jgi:hypothetical protein
VAAIVADALSAIVELLVCHRKFDRAFIERLTSVPYSADFRLFDTYPQIRLIMRSAADVITPSGISSSR